MRLEVSGINFKYNGVPVLNDVSFSVDKNEIVTVIGPNGSGKTTLLKCIEGILEPQKGEIYIEGNSIISMERRKIAQKIAYVPQVQSGNPNVTVFETVLIGRKPYFTWSPSEKDIEIVSKVLNQLGMQELSQRDLSELSGGEKQKTLIARAIAQESEIMLLDEPTSNLDLKHQLEALEIVKSLAKKRGISVIMALHDLNLASRYSDTLVMLNDGTIHIKGDPKQVITPENIKSVFDVESCVHNHFQFPDVVAEKPVEQNNSSFTVPLDGDLS